MIKRTGEHVLTWIGVFFQLLAVLSLAFIVPMANTQDFKDEFINTAREQQSDLSNANIDQMASIMSNFAVGGLIFATVVLILGVIGGILISKKAKAAGIILIIAGILSIFINFFAMILWIIAGIMLLVRKPKRQVYGKDYDGDEVNEHTNSFILTDEQKEREQRQIKDYYNEDENDHTRSQDRRGADSERRQRKDDFERDEAQRLKNEKDNDPYKY